MQWISEFAESIGMFYTSFDKKADFEKTAHISQIEFLKRSFVMRDHVCYAPLRWSSIMETPMWIDGKSDNPKADMVNMWRSVLLELRHYPREDYEAYIDIARRWCDASGVPTVFPTWDSAHALHLHMNT
jgi:hypothetical protein